MQRGECFSVHLYSGDSQRVIKFGQTIITIVVLFAYLLASSTVEGAESVQIEGCPTTLTVTLPSEFHPPTVDPQLASGLNANPARKTIYSVGFISQSLQPEHSALIAYILIGSLGSTVNHQGGISQANFQALKEELYKENPLDQPAVQEYMDALKRGADEHWKTTIPIGDTFVLEVFEMSTSAMAILGITTMLLSDEILTAYSIARFDLVEGCLVYAGITLPTTLSVHDVKDILRRFVVN